MNGTHLEGQLEAFQAWKQGLLETVTEYGDWLVRHRLNTESNDNRIRQCLEMLHNDRLTIAFVAEFSRGKTELINAIFFSAHGQRLLPSTAGRTTMCPTEIFYDQESGQSYIRLLPIESRLQESGISALREKPSLWTTLPLPIDSPEQVAENLREVVKTRRVSREEAIRLGLYDSAQHLGDPSAPETVEIPQWRHALISFPHPLLKQGLTILDTPGLNALGSEPELTLGMLPSAQAILFVLAADAGVTRSDLAIWRSYIRGMRSKRRHGLVVALNKIDVLWDELSDEAGIAETIERQCRDTARILGIDQSAVFPVSAHKGLLGKIRQDKELLHKSRLLPIEEHLGRSILGASRTIIQDTAIAEVSQMLESSIALVSSRLKSVHSQLDELTRLDGKSREVIEQLQERTRQEQRDYDRTVSNYQASRKVIREQTASLNATLDRKQLTDLITRTHARMSGNWTTSGLRASMEALFQELRANMQVAVEESDQLRELLRSIYRRFADEYGFSAVQPKMFSLMRHRVELEMLYQEAEIFRNSPITAITGKHSVVKRFFIVMVSRARDIFYQAQQEADAWLNTALEPLAFQILQHKEQIDRRLLDLQKIHHSQETLQGKIEQLQHRGEALNGQLTLLRNQHFALNSTIPLPTDGRQQQPGLVKNLAVS